MTKVKPAPFYCVPQQIFEEGLETKLRSGDIIRLDGNRFSIVRDGKPLRCQVPGRDSHQDDWECTNPAFNDPKVIAWKAAQAFGKPNINIVKVPEEETAWRVA